MTMMKHIYIFHVYLLPIHIIYLWHGNYVYAILSCDFETLHIHPLPPSLSLLDVNVDVDMCCINLYLDEDIGLHGFNPALFLSTSKCAFTPRPLIVQPLIAESNQYLLFVNEKPWREGRWDQVVASEVSYLHSVYIIFSITLIVQYVTI
jgi:hypothetical protein